jgi:sec-independent protein translocase protein TatA
MLAEIFSMDGMVFIVLAVAVLFGSTQIPKLARSLGSARSEFKKGLTEVHDTSSDTESSAGAPIGGQA